MSNYYYNINIKLNRLTDIYKLVKITKQVPIAVDVKKTGFSKTVDGKSILGIFSLGATDLEVILCNPTTEIKNYFKRELSQFQI